MSQDTAFIVPETYNRQTLFETLAGKYIIKSEGERSVRTTFYDTFDWRLYNQSLILYQRQQTFYLRKLSRTKTLHSLKIDAVPTFAWDLPEEDLKDILTPVIEMRALLAVAELQLHNQSYRILNNWEKTVVRLTLSQTMANNEALPLQITLAPLRGYDKELQAVAHHLIEIGCQPHQEDIFYQACQSAGKEPGSYSSKINLELNPDERADTATKTLLKSMLQIIHLNAPYIKDDIDTEFLHDFRVAVRRTRSALSQIKGVFPVEKTAHFKSGFAAIGRMTNQLRDLDVYLLAEDNYKAMLPDLLRPDIEPLFDFLKHKRESALQQVIEGLHAESYAKTLADWETFLDSPPLDHPDAPNAGLPIKLVAQKRIYKIYRRIVKRGRAIIAAENPADEKLHDLRIECKKLRYLLEFFASLFPREDILRLIKQLKRLQNNLGDFNDVCVQEEYLLGLAGELPADSLQDRKTLLAVGALVENFAQQRENIKAEFASAFENFAAPDNKALFKTLFKLSESPPLPQPAPPATPPN